MIEIYGNGVSGGLAVGKLFFLNKSRIDINRITVDDTEGEVVRYKKAAEDTVKELDALKKKAEIEAGEKSAEIFEVHKMMVEAEDFSGEIIKCIERERCNAEYATDIVSKNLISMLLQMDDEYMNGRVADIKDITQRILCILTNGETALPNIPDDNGLIICADDLSPSETVKMDKSKVLAFVTRYGSAQSHTAILARTMNIPAIVGLGDKLTDAYNGSLAIADGDNGTLYIEPDKEALEKAEKKKSEIKHHMEKLKTLVGMDNITVDGKKVKVYANIGTPDDLDSVIENDAGGIGLFRSEFLYLERNTYPTEEEQFKAYKLVAENMQGKRVIIRTLDIGADKSIDYLDLGKEENPALGFRAVRICLSRKEVFKMQIRAILKASNYGRLSLMIPMITSEDEVCEVKEIIEDVKRELLSENILFDKNIEFGIMIETPAAVMISDILAKEVDFFSIGTNDLTQYTLATDRQNPLLERFYKPKHKGIMRMIKMTVDNAHKEGIWCGICGEIAADLSMTETFLKMGVDEFSVNPSMILPLREKVRSVNVGKVKSEY